MTSTVEKKKVVSEVSVQGKKEAVVDEKDVKSPTEPKAEEITSKDYYFDSYSHFGIHEEMLKDDVRTRTYMNSILQNRHLFKDKVVLDVGCGTGILCMFAAKAGAKKVIGVECAGIYHQAKKIVKANGFEDKITLVHGKLEEVELPVDKVDIIVSEWMGYFLLYESMMDSVLFARDKWLAPGGMLFPDKASMYICAIEDADYRAEKIDFWKNVYGFDMSCIQELALMEPLVDVCNPNQIISDSDSILEVDLYTVKKEDLDFSSDFSIKITRNDFCHAFVAYFTATFSKSHKPLVISTDPRCKYTHWKQTVFYMDKDFPAAVGDVIKGHISCSRNGKNPRDLNIELRSECDGKEAKHSHSRKYRLR